MFLVLGLLVAGLLLVLGGFFLGRWSVQRSQGDWQDRQVMSESANANLQQMRDRNPACFTLPVLNQSLETNIQQQISALQQSKDSYRQLAEDMPAMIGRFLPDSTLTYVNSAYCKYFNQQPTELLGRQFLDFLPDNERQAVQAQYLSLTSDAPIAIHEHAVGQMDGSQRWQRWMNRAFFDAQGNLTSVQSIGIDITDQKQREAEQVQAAEALRQERNLLSRIMATSPAGIVVLNSDGQITFANTRAEIILGLTKDEAIGRIYNAPTWQLQSLDGSPFPDSELPFVQVMQTKQPVFDVQHGIKHPSGQLLFLSINAAPLFDPSGEVDCVVATIEDITERQRSEHELRQALATNQALLDAIPDLILRISRDGIYRGGFPSPEVPMLSPIDDHLGKSLRDILPAELAQQRLEMIERTCQTKRTQIQEYQLCVDGEIRYEESRCVVCGENEVMMLVRDITDRKRAETALRENEARFRQLAENIQEVFWLSDAEIDRILYISPAYEQIWGRSVESINIDPKSFVNAIHPDDRQRVASNLAHPDRVFEIEYRVIQPGGEIRWIRDRGFPIFDASGNVTRRAGLAQDITERKQAEEQLHNLAERLELALQSANIGIWEWDLATDHLIWDDRMFELYGILASDFDEIWMAWETRLHPDDLLKAQAVVQHSLANGQDYQMEFRVVWPDGSIHHIASYALIQCDSEGKAIRLVGANFDISDRKQAELEIRQLNEALEQQNRNLEILVAKRTDELMRRTTQLEASNKELESFSYSVSHDLRAPLRHIHGFVNALQQRLQGQEVLTDAKVVHYLQVIENSSQKMAQLIDGLLTLSRVGRKPIVYAPVSLRQLVDEAVEIVHSNLEPPNPVEFVIGDLPTVEGDATLLQQVLNNLIGNAVKFSRQQPQPRVELGQLPDGAIFIKDNGVGFQMKYADKLFGAFQRLHAQTEFEGTGIGLAIVQRIIHRHGGIIWAESEPNQGTVFYFTIN